MLWCNKKRKKKKKKEKNTLLMQNTKVNWDFGTVYQRRKVREGERKGIREEEHFWKHLF